jgi:acyl-CoA dehydrogenase
MAWDFETEPEFQRELDWIDAFVRDEIEPLDYVLGNPYDKADARARAMV